MQRKQTENQDCVVDFAIEWIEINANAGSQTERIRFRARVSRDCVLRCARRSESCVRKSVMNAEMPETPGSNLIQYIHYGPLELMYGASQPVRAH